MESAKAGQGPPIRFCCYCGHRVFRQLNEEVPRTVCSNCHAVHYESPQPLVVCLIFAGEKLLLMKRALPPFENCWAPPGGFVEKGETLQDAAVREVAEETGIALDRNALFPHAVASVTHMNQVYVVFLAQLIDEITPAPGPEAIETAWFSEDDFPYDEFWRPKRTSEVKDLFEQVRTSSYKFYLSEAKGLELHNVKFSLGYEPLPSQVRLLV